MSLTQIIPGMSRAEVFPRLKPSASKPTCRVTQFPYIFAAARHIGVHRITLYRVLMNQLPDRGDYAAKYHAFVAEHSKSAA